MYITPHLSELCIVKVYPLLEHTVVAERGVVSAVVRHHCREIVLVGTRCLTDNMVKRLWGRYILTGYIMMGGRIRCSMDISMAWNLIWHWSGAIVVLESSTSCIGTRMD